MQLQPADTIRQFRLQWGENCGQALYSLCESAGLTHGILQDFSMQDYPCAFECSGSFVCLCSDMIDFGRRFMKSVQEENRIVY